MTILGWFCNPSPNSLQTYRDQFARDFPLVNGSQVFENELDRWDFTVLVEADRSFERILRSRIYTLLLLGAFSRLQIIEEDGPLDKYAIQKKESLITLIKFAVAYASEENNNALIEQAIQVIRVSQLFFRGNVSRLGFLYRRMEANLPVSIRHPLQRAPVCEETFSYPIPRPPPLCCEDPSHWNPKDFPEGYCVSWAQMFTIVSGIIDDEKCTIELGSGVVEMKSLIQRTIELDWRGMGNRVSEYVHWLSFPIRWMLGNPSEVCAVFSLSDLFADRGTSPDSSPVSKPDPLLTVYLIETLDNPYIVWDTSQFATQRPTSWQPGAESPHFVPIVYLACQFGLRMFVDAFLKYPDAFHAFYPPLGSLDSPYQRAVHNHRDPTVLITLLEEAKRKPDSLLAREINRFASTQELPSRLPGWIAGWFPGTDWRKHPQNHLVLACVEGNLELAKYLVAEEKARALARCPPEATKEDKDLAAAVAVSMLVQRKSSFGGPSETPVELAANKGHLDLIQFLCAYGARPSLDVRMQETEHLAGQMVQIGRRFEETKRSLREQAVHLRGEVQLSEKQLDELTAVTVAFRSIESERKEIIDESLDLADQIGESLSRSLERIKRLSAAIPLERVVLSRWQNSPFSQIPLGRNPPMGVW